MKIKFGNTTLCGENESPKNFSAALRKRVQNDDTILAQKSTVSDRGNEVMTISFGVEKSHKNPQAAEKALFDLLNGVSRQSPARLEITFEKNGECECAVFENAVLSKCAASVDGRISTHMFDFTTGKKEIS
jgi:hypothetical protein